MLLRARSVLQWAAVGTPAVLSPSEFQSGSSQCGISGQGREGARQGISSLSDIWGIERIKSALSSFNEIMCDLLFQTLEWKGA